jgi:hypothetical protein
MKQPQDKIKDSSQTYWAKIKWKQRVESKKFWIDKYLKNPFIFIPAVIILIIISFYFIHFRHGKLSYLNQDWAGFSAYMQMIFTFVNLILFAAIAITTYEYSKTSDVQRMIDDRRSQMPVIGFSRNNEQEYYNIRNLGKGGAFNIRVKTHFLEDQSKWKNCKIIHNMPSSGPFYPMNFTTDCNMLCATYEDLFGHKYFTIMENDTLSIIDMVEPQHLERYAKQVEKVYKESSTKPEYIDIVI